MGDRFLLSSDECELVLALSDKSSLDELARHFRKDRSVISRSLAKIASKQPVIEKQGSRWALTSKGQHLNRLTRENLLQQQVVLEQSMELTLGVPREFSARVLAPHLDVLLKETQGLQLRVLNHVDSYEDALDERELDVAIASSRLKLVNLASKPLFESPYLMVGSRDLQRRYEAQIKKGQWAKIPHVECGAIVSLQNLKLDPSELNTRASFSDIASARSACVAGLGWAVLPEYAIQEELHAKKLVLLSRKSCGSESFAMWWFRDRKFLGHSLELLARSLKSAT